MTVAKGDRNRDGDGEGKEKQSREEEYLQADTHRILKYFSF